MSVCRCFHRKKKKQVSLFFFWRQYGVALFPHSISILYVNKYMYVVVWGIHILFWIFQLFHNVYCLMDDWCVVYVVFMCKLNKNLPAILSTIPLPYLYFPYIFILSSLRLICVCSNWIFSFFIKWRPHCIASTYFVEYSKWNFVSI